MDLHCELNSKFVRERQSDGTWSWWGTNPNLVWEAEMYSRNTGSFHTGNFMKYMYYTRQYQAVQNGKYKVIGNYLQAAYNGDTQPFIEKETSVEIIRNKPFFIPGSADKKRHNFGFGSILDECHYVGDYPLTDHDRQEINKIYLGF